jgi:hypothetical protein
MVEHLRLRWRDDLSMEALLGLRDDLEDMLGRIRATRHITNPVFKCPACGHIGRREPIPTSVFAPRYWRWLVSAWPRENRHGRLKQSGRLTERRRDLTFMATLRRQNPLDSQGARTPMNREPKTDLMQLVTRRNRFRRRRGRGRSADGFATSLVARNCSRSHRSGSRCAMRMDACCWRVTRRAAFGSSLVAP